MSDPHDSITDRTSGGMPINEPVPDLKFYHAAIDQIDRLQAEIAEERAIRERVCGLIAETAIALNGPEPPLTRWSYHDIPERVRRLVADGPMMDDQELPDGTPVHITMRQALMNAITAAEALAETMTQRGATVERLREGLRKIMDTGFSHPYAGVTCGELARDLLKDRP